MRKTQRVRACAVAAALLIGLGRAVVAQATADSAAVSRLPIVELPARDSGTTLVVFLSGDGGWADIDRRIAARLAQRGDAVAGLNLRDYLKTKRTPEEVADAVSAIARVYGARWHRSGLLIVGFSRGANVAPFAVSRFSPELSARLRGVALIGLNRAANFKWHLQDVIRDVIRDDDVPTLPELAKLQGIPIVCVYGSDERESACRSAQPDVRRIERRGGHHLDGDYEALADLIHDSFAR
jgi:type IV secretory pathway VirJ component